jgi:hypothetical protein
MYKLLTSSFAPFLSGIGEKILNPRGRFFSEMKQHQSIKRTDAAHFFAKYFYKSLNYQWSDWKISNVLAWHEYSPVWSLLKKNWLHF